MGQLLHLESFDNGGSGPSESHPEFLRGFDEGKSAGLSEAAEKGAYQLTILQSTLDDARFTYAEARQAVLADLNAIIEAALSQLLPAAATVGLAETLRQDLQNSLINSTPAAMVLSVPPALAELCEQIVADTGAGHVSIRSDPLIGEHAIWFDSDVQQSCVDFEPALTAVRSALQCLQPHPTRKSENG